MHFCGKTAALVCRNSHLRFYKIRTTKEKKQKRFEKIYSTDRPGRRRENTMKTMLMIVDSVILFAASFFRKGMYADTLPEA